MALDPSHEPAHRRLVELYGQAGRQGAALRQYRECVRTLDAELDLGPSAETAALLERLRAEGVRLERVGGIVQALCSVDGNEWFTIGSVKFPIESPLEVGLHAIGHIDRTVYPGKYPDGTAIRFESFKISV